MAKMKKSVTGTSPVWQVCTYEKKINERRFKRYFVELC